MLRFYKRSWPKIGILLLLALCLSLTACGGKKKVVAPKWSGGPCQDLSVFPQNLGSYANAAGGNRQLVSHMAQEGQMARQKDRMFRPWSMSSPTKWIQQSLGKNFNMRPDNAYTDGKKPFPADVWQQLVLNSNKSAYPARTGRGITLRHSNLRAMPSNMHFFLNPDRPGEGYPFDYLQHSSIPLGTPLFICHISKDGRWILAETAITAGWLPAEDVAEVDESFIRQWLGTPMAALVRDKVSIGTGLSHIGTILPSAGGGGGGTPVSSLLYPVAGEDGKAKIATSNISSGAAVSMPLALTPANVAAVGDQMMGQAYGWGGLDGLRDCSAMTRDLFAPFGIWLPRNSSRQAQNGRPIALAGLSSNEKEQKIIQDATPFLSMIWLKGHIGLYLGTYQGKAAMFHNIWGVRTKVDSNDCNGRAVIGKAVVTSLRPGVERPDVCTPASLLDRIEKAVVLPD